jgi:hypothetical protein
VDPEPLAFPAPALTRHRHIDRSSAAGQEPPELRGASVAQHGALAARQDNGEPPSLIAQAAVTDCVHTSMEPMQPTDLDPPLIASALSPSAESWVREATPY